MPLTLNDIPQLVQLTHIYFTQPDRSHEVKHHLNQLGISPKNVDDFTFILQNTTDMYLLQFAIQSLRRIIIKYHTHLISGQIIPLTGSILEYLRKYSASNIPHPTLASLSLLFGTIVRYFWVSLPEIRSFVADAAVLLQESPPQCYSACVLLTELVDEISSHGSNSVAATSSSSSISNNQSVTVPFATNMVPAIVVAATSILYQLLSLFGYQSSPRYIDSGHDWGKYPLNTKVEFNTNDVSPEIAKNLISKIINLIYRCIKFDGAGYGGRNNSSSTSINDDDEYNTTFLKPSAWEPLYRNNFLLLLTISSAEICHDNVQLVQISLQLIGCYLNVKSSTWVHSVHQSIACKYASIFVVMILDSIVGSSSTATNPNSSIPIFIQEPRLFKAATGLLKSIFKGFSVLDIINSFHPLIKCDINFDPILAQQGIQLQNEISIFFSQTFRSIDSIHKEHIDIINTYNISNPGNQQPLPSIPKISDPENLQPSNSLSTNQNLYLYDSTTTTTPYTTATLLSSKTHPCRQYQQAMFNAWLHRIYNFSVKVYSLGFQPETLAKNAPNIHNTGTQPAALSIYDLTPQSLISQTCDLGDLSLSELIDVYNHLLTLWHSLAEAYTIAMNTPTNTTNTDSNNGTRFLRGYHEGGPSSSSSSSEMSQMTTSMASVWPKSVMGMSNTLIGSVSNTTGTSKSSANRYGHGPQGRRHGIVSSAVLGMLNEVPLWDEADSEMGLLLPVGTTTGSTSTTTRKGGVGNGGDGSSQQKIGGNDQSSGQMTITITNPDGTTTTTTVPSSSSSSSVQTSSYPQPPQISTLPLISLQIHLDATIAIIMDYRHHDDLVSMLPQVLPQISTSYLRAMISGVGALFDSPSFQDICYSEVETLNELFFGSHVLREQLAIYAVIARASPTSLSNSLGELWEVLKSAYLHQLSLLPAIAHRLIYELNMGAHQLIQQADRDQNNGQNGQNGQNNNQNGQNQHQTSPFSIYSTLLTTLFSHQHEDRHLINITHDEKEYLTRLFQLEAQIGFILCLITTLFQPKHNFFSNKSSTDFDIVTSIHVQCSTLLCECLRFYAIRYGHYNISTTPQQYQSSNELIPRHISAISLETILSYLTMTPGICPQPLSQHYVATKFNIPIHQQTLPFFGISVPLFIVPPSAYLAHSLLNGIGAFTDSLVYRQYLYRSQSYASTMSNVKNFSDQILTQTFAALGPNLLCYSANSDIPPPQPGSTQQQQQQLDSGLPYYQENIFGQKLLRSPPKDIITNASNQGQNEQVIATYDNPLFLLVNTDGIVTFHEIVNIAAFFSLHVLNIYPLSHTFCVPNIELAISFLSHLTNTVNLAIMLSTLPSWKLLMKYFHTLAITRLPSPLPLHSVYSFACDTFDYDTVIQITNPDLIDSDPLILSHLPQKITQIRYNQRLLWSLSVHQVPHESLIRHIKAAIPYYNPLIKSNGDLITPTLKHATSASSQGTFRVDFKTCLQLYYELIARATRRSPSLLVTPFDSLFGAISLVLENTKNTSSNEYDSSLFAATVNLICNGLTGAGRTAPGEHIYTWVSRFIPTLIRIGMTCSEMMYNDRSLTKKNNQNGQSGQNMGQNGNNWGQNNQNNQNNQGPQSQYDQNSQNIGQNGTNTDGGIDIDSIINALDRLDGLDDDNNDGINNNGTDSQVSEYFKAVRSIRVEPLVAHAMTNTLGFITTCCSNRGRSYPVSAIIEQAVSMVSAFFNSTKKVFAKYLDSDASLSSSLSSSSSSSSAAAVGGSSPSSLVLPSSSLGYFHRSGSLNGGSGGNGYLGYSGNDNINNIDDGDEYNHIFSFNQKAYEKELEEVSTSTMEYPTVRILYPYHNDNYINCLTAALTLASEIIHTTVSTLGGDTSGNHFGGQLPSHLTKLIPEILIHLYHIPIPILISNLELIEEVLGLISNLFRSLMQTILITVHPLLILHYIHLLFAVIDSYQHIPISHPHYTTLALAATCLGHFYQYLPHTIPQIEITNHDCLYHVTQTHVAPNYYTYLSDAMINGTNHAISNAWDGILRFNANQIHLQQTTPQNIQYIRQVYPVVSDSPQNPVLFRTETLKNDQNSILSILSFLNTHSIDNVIPEDMVTFFGKSNTQQQLQQKMRELQENNEIISSSTNNSSSASSLLGTFGGGNGGNGGIGGGNNPIGYSSSSSTTGLSTPHQYQYYHRDGNGNNGTSSPNSNYNDRHTLETITAKTMLKNLNNSPQHHVDIPLMNAVLTSTHKPYPLSTSTTTAHSIKVLRRIISAVGGGGGGGGGSCSISSATITGSSYNNDNNTQNTRNYYQNNNNNNQNILNTRQQKLQNIFNSSITTVVPHPHHDHNHQRNQLINNSSSSNNNRMNSTGIGSSGSLGSGIDNVNGNIRDGNNNSGNGYDYDSDNEIGSRNNNNAGQNGSGFSNNHNNLDLETEEKNLSTQLVTISLINILNHILFESDSNGGTQSGSNSSTAAPCLMRLVPYFIHFHPNILQLYVKSLILNISISSCQLNNIDPSLIAIRIQQQANVTFIWATATVTGQRGMSLPPMGVISLPIFTPNGTLVGGSSSSSSSSGVGGGSGRISIGSTSIGSSNSTSSSSNTNGGLYYNRMASEKDTGDGYGVTMYEISDLVDLSTSQVLGLFAKVVTGMVNKPSF